MVESARIEIICHATEGFERLKAASESLFGSDFSVSRSEGHWGNPVWLLEAEVDGKATIDRISCDVPVSDFDSHVEDGKFYLRLSKEAILKRNLAPGDDIKVAITVPTYPSDDEEVARIVAGLWKG